MIYHSTTQWLGSRKALTRIRRMITRSEREGKRMERERRRVKWKEKSRQGREIEKRSREKKRIGGKDRWKKGVEKDSGMESVAWMGGDISKRNESDREGIFSKDGGSFIVCVCIIIFIYRSSHTWRRRGRSFHRRRKPVIPRGLGPNVLRREARNGLRGERRTWRREKFCIVLSQTLIDIFRFWIGPTCRLRYRRRSLRQDATEESGNVELKCVN